ncbi:hypothetical protein CCACVL1_17948 [Corchorus capsularis]|uniref:Reverse transcriptase zinc-binding domain-containing protein n=1 Tax=Corchorus capsularis TaxID=210143 RepID=A0A1R3HNZ5_COCAP|nr:hypothetical protein CCACVL1_17948 [Corchorus capsularis]
MHSCDTFIWHGTSNGHYTVKSGYYVARNLLGKVSPALDYRAAIWSRLWGASVQPKIKFFLWRVRHNILPTKLNWQRRGIPIDDACPMCNGTESSLLHIFFTCPFSRKVWELCCPWIMDYLQGWMEEVNFWDCVLEEASQLGTLDLVAYNLLWSIWPNRNKSLHELVCKMPSALCAAAIRRVAEVVASSI